MSRVHCVRLFDAADIISNNYGVSTIAQSIFSSVPSESPRISTFSHKLNGNHSKCDGKIHQNRYLETHSDDHIIFIDSNFQQSHNINVGR